MIRVLTETSHDRDILVTGARTDSPSPSLEDSVTRVSTAAPEAGPRYAVTEAEARGCRHPVQRRPRRPLLLCSPGEMMSDVMRRHTGRIIGPVTDSTCQQLIRLIFLVTRVTCVVTLCHVSE